MKRITKILAGMAMFAAVVGLTGCADMANAMGGNKDKTITGTSDRNKKVNATNTSGDIKRGFVDTKLNHYGAKVDVRMTTDSKGVMGVMFDMQNSTAGVTFEDEKGKTQDAVNFFIVGVSNAGNKMRPYISKYVNVKNIQAENFGAPKGSKTVNDILTTTQTKELVIEQLDPDTNNGIEKSKFEKDGEYKFNVEFYPCTATGAQLYTKANGNALYNTEPTDEDDDEGGITPKYTGKVYFKVIMKAANGDEVLNKLIDASATGYDNSDKNKASKQRKVAYYYNVQPDSKMVGGWKTEDFYSAAEVDEE